MGANKAAAPGDTAPENVSKDPKLLPIEQHRISKKIARPVFAGVCSAQGWKTGKAVTEAEFLAAVQKFKSAPMSGARKESEAKK